MGRKVVIEIDAATFARVLREQRALPITEDEAERLARAIETSIDDDRFLANMSSAIRLLVDRFEHSATSGDQALDRSG